MFSHLSVILFTGGYTDTTLGRHPLGRHPPGRHQPWADTSPGQTPPGQTLPTPLGRHPSPQADNPMGKHPQADTSPGQTPPGQTPSLSRQASPGQTHPPRDGHCSERYASYWNAFLYNDTFGIFTKNLGP